MTAPRPKRRPTALHQPLSWLDDELRSNVDAQFSALTMDVCHGVECCLQLLHADILTRNANLDADPGGEVTPLLGQVDAERLLLLATAASRMLADRAEERIDHANSRISKSPG